MRADYAAFFASLFFSRLGDQILLFIVPLVVFQTTNSVSWAGFAFFVEALPRFLMFPLSGLICDRYSPVKVLHLSQMFRAAACILVVGLHFVYEGIVWLVVLSALCGILTTVGIMAREVLMPRVFQQYSYTRTLSYSQIADQTGLVLGPLVAASLLAVWSWNLVVAACAVIFVLADLSMVYWQRRCDAASQQFEQQSTVGLWKSLRTACDHLMAMNALKKIVALAFGVNLIIGGTLATSAFMVLGIHESDQNTYAVIQMAGAGVTIGILFYLSRAALPLRAMGCIGFIAIVVGGALSAISPYLLVYSVGFLLIVGFDKMFNVYMRNVRQQVIPPEDFGKTVGVLTLLNNLSQPFAGLAVAVLAGPLGTRGVLLLLVSLAAIIGVASLRWFGGNDVLETQREG